MSNKKRIKTKKKKEIEKVDPLTQTIRDTLKNMGKAVDPYQEKLLVQILKSFLVGGLALIVDIILYCVLCCFIHPLLANFISMVISIILGLVMGIKYVYDARNKKNNIQQFLLLNGIGFIFTEGSIYGLVVMKDWNKILVKILAIIVVLILKIFIKRFILQKQNKLIK